MKAERWNVLSDFHNEWLEAGPLERDRVRQRVAAEHPELVSEFDALAAAASELHGFLETPALTLETADLASESPGIAPDTMIGPYRVVTLLARGGMGEVYRASDVRLHRDVALKVLSQTETRDAQRVDRFLQEARVTASLDHPNIVRLYDVGFFAGTPYLVTELLEGEPLRARLQRGPLPVEDATRIAAEMAAGLVAAHTAGLVHRDLKPENIFLTRSGPSKILDFGIAKLEQDPTAADGISTVTGVLMGTAGYLSPEQIRGETVDGRTDLFALGSILFEMLTGRRAFEREHTVDTLYAIVHEPIGDALDERQDIPPALADIVSRLMEKSPGARFQSASDLAWALDRLAIGGSPRLRGRTNKLGSEAARARHWWARVAGATALAAALVGFGWWLRAPAVQVTSAVSVNRSTWSFPADIRLDSAPAVSPDGRFIAFTGAGSSGLRLYVRAMDSLEATPVVGTDGARQPFWSPDSRSIGYFARGKLMKLTLAGGTPVEIADAPEGRGGAWSSTGTIVFCAMLIDAPLMKVSAEGGRPEPATVVNAEQGDNSHRWPAFLPDGIHFVYFVRSTADERRGVYLGRVDRPPSGSDPMLFRSESQAVVAPTSDRDSIFLLSVTGGRIEARAIDTARTVLRGDPQAIDLQVGAITPYHPAMVAASMSALATVSSAPSFGARLASIGRNGEELRYWGQRETLSWPRLSSDGRWLARQILDPVRGNPDIWAENLERGTRVAVTAGPGDDAMAVWSPDGKRMAYVVGQRTPKPRLTIAGADGTGVIGEVACPETSCTPTDWSIDGRSLVVNVRRAKGMDVWLLPALSDDRARPILDAPYVERDARVSPDGRWIAYVSEESGRPEISVRSLEGPRQREVMSAGGGDQPVWRGDGKELFFVDRQGLLRAIPVRPAADGKLSFGLAVPLKVPPIGSGHFGTQYDVTRDGRRIFFRDASPEPAPREMTIVLGWQGLLGGTQ